MANRLTLTPGSVSSVPHRIERVVMVCEKCGLKLQPPGATEPSASQRLKQELKQAALARGGSSAQRTRVVTSSCLDLCPVGRIAVGVVDAGVAGGSSVGTAQPRAQFYTVDPTQVSSSGEWEPILK